MVFFPLDIFHCAVKFGSSLKQITVADLPLYSSEQVTDGTECICQTQC